jgi:hypothetical protein
MRKIAIVSAAVAAIAATGLYGASRWVQYRAVGDVDAVFETLRASGMKATHGPIEFDFWTKSLSIADLSFQAPGDSGARTTIAKVHAIGLTPHPSEISASRVEVSGFDLKSGVANEPGVSYGHKAPKIVVSQFSAPAAFPTVASRTEMLNYFARVKASAIEMPQGETSFDLPSPGVKNTQPANFSYKYTNAALKNFSDGRIGALTIDKIDLGGGQSALPVTGVMNSYATTDIDVFTILSLYGTAVPARPDQSGYVRVQGKTTIGAYSISAGGGVTVSVDSISTGVIAIDPAKINSATISELSKLAPQPVASLAPAKLGEFSEKVASVYEGVKFDDFEMRGMHVATAGSTDAGIKIGSMRMAGFDKGRLGEFAMTDTAMTVPGIPQVKIGYASVSGMDFAKLMRLTAQMGGAGQATSAERAMGLLGLIEGFEIRDYDVPDMATGKLKGRIEAIKGSWSKFVGGLPQVTRLTMKFQLPVDEPEPALAFLNQMGLANVRMSYDVGTTWDNATKTIVAEPVDIDVENVGALSIKGRLNAPFNQVPQLEQQALVAAFMLLQVETFSMTFRDAGLVRIYQSSLNGSATPSVANANPLVEFRQRLLSDPIQNTTVLALLDAAIRFLDRSGQTIALTATPKSQLSIVQLVASSFGSADDKATMLSQLSILLDQFNIDATVRP